MSETPAVTTERQALLTSLAQQAAAWWRLQLEDPGYASKFDNGDRSETGELTQILASMAALSSRGPAPASIERFRQVLADKVLAWLLVYPMPVVEKSDHDWMSTPEQLAARAARPARDLILSTDYGPEGLVREAAEEARVSGFPWKTTMWVSWDADPAKCYIEVRKGYNRPTQRLPPLPEVTPA